MYPWIKVTMLRSELGSLSALMMAALSLICVGLGAFAVDFAHVLAVKNEMQDAVDAAALAGATYLAKSSKPGQDDVLACERESLSVASFNQADARAVSNQSKDTQVTVTVTPSPDPAEPSVVQVDAQMMISHLLAPIFGRTTDNVMASALAGSYANTTTLAPNQAFPIAVSADQWPDGPGGPNKPLNQLRMGDRFVAVVRPTGQPGRNAVWTSFNYGSANTNTYVELINQVLGKSPPDPIKGVPELEAGVSRIALDNGINRGTDLDGAYRQPITDKPFIVLPVILGDQYNQKQIVHGFVAVKLTEIRYQAGAYRMQGYLTKGIVRGLGGQLPGSGDAKTDNALADLSTSVVKLLSAAQEY